MNDFKNVFENKHYRKEPYKHHKCINQKFNGYSYRESREEPSFRRYRDNLQISQSTLCAHQYGKYPSTSTCINTKSPSKSTICCSNEFTKHVMGEDVASLPYYIVPVLYVPHKPLYEAKQMLEPNIYKAYHCRSKNQLQKRSKFNPKLSKSKSLLNLHSKKPKEKFDYPYVPKKGKYSFECYDEYFRRCIEDKRSSSDISFYTEKSYCHLPLTPKRSSKFEDAFGAAEKRKSISKDFPELFGVHESKTTDFTFRPRVGEDVPTWDSPRTTNALIETEMMEKTCISAQTSFVNLKWRWRGQNERTDTQGTQTIIQDIKKNVLVLPNDKFKRSIRRQPITEEVPKKIYDGKVLNQQLSDGHLGKTNQKPFGFNRNSSRFAVSRLTKSAMSNSLCPSKRSSKRSMDSENTSIL